MTILNDDAIDNYINYQWALAILFISVTLDATFGGLRKIYTEGIPTLQVMFIFTWAQWFFITIFWFIFGTDLYSRNYGPGQIMYALLAGFNVQVAEYLFTLCTAYLKSAISTTCLSIEFIFGSLILYVILPDGIDITFLALGLGLIAGGIIASVVPYFINQQEQWMGKKILPVTLARPISRPTSTVDLDGLLQRSVSSSVGDDMDTSVELELKGGTDADTNTDTKKANDARTPLLPRKQKKKPPGPSAAEEEEDSPQPQSQSQLQKKEGDSPDEAPPLFWIMLAVIAGLIMSSWAIFTTLATLDDTTLDDGGGGINHTADLYFIFSCGQLIALPFLIFVFGYLDAVGLKLKDEAQFSLDKYFSEVLSMPWHVYGLIVSLGLLKDTFEAGYFYVLGSGELPRAAIYATLSAVAPIATLGSFFVFREYDDAPYISWFYLFTFLSFAFFGLGIWVVLDYSFDDGDNHGFDDTVDDDYQFPVRRLLAAVTSNYLKP